MQTFLLRTKATVSQHKGELLSVAAHLALLSCLFGGIRISPRIVPARLLGTVEGNTLLTYYAPGSVKPISSKSPLKNREKPKSTTAQHPIPSPPQVDHSQATETNAGIGTAAESGQGEGDITIALETYFPYPKPDLSTLPHGTKGDVILNAVIDEHGKISELTLLKGLGSPVDESVIAIVQQWQYTPAKKNGVPVASERELHFHYERG
jgi:periplasmic protein TonB